MKSPAPDGSNLSNLQPKRKIVSCNFDSAHSHQVRVISTRAALAQLGAAATSAAATCRASKVSVGHQPRYREIRRDGSKDLIHRGD